MALREHSEHSQAPFGEGLGQEGRRSGGLCQEGREEAHHHTPQLPQHRSLLLLSIPDPELSAV